MYIPIPGIIFLILAYPKLQNLDTFIGNDLWVLMRQYMDGIGAKGNISP